MRTKDSPATRVPSDSRLNESVQKTGEISFVLDGLPTKGHAGETIWQAARRSGIEIPHLCLSTEPDFHPDGNCRLCLVEIEGWPMLAPSCVVRVESGMSVKTHSERAQRVRRLVMQLLRADVVPKAGSEMARWCDALEVVDSPFPGTQTKHDLDESQAGMLVDLNACIDCLRCAQACGEVGGYDVIGMAYRGVRQKIVFDFDDPMGPSTCVSCGACAQTCPTGAIRFRGAE